MSQISGENNLVKKSIGLAAISEIFRLCLPPMLMGIISAKMTTAKVSAPERMPTQKLSKSLMAKSVISVVPPMLVMLLRMTSIEIGRLILSLITSRALILLFDVELCCSSAIFRTFMMGTEKRAASAHEQMKEMNITKNTAIINVVIFDLHYAYMHGF